jgi:membrane complex biogenesis BtpA family protein
MEPFAVEKPLIGMIHLLPLAGSVKYVKGSSTAILDAALRDLYALESGGADGAIVENLGDAPYAITAPRETIAMMSVVVHQLVEKARIPVGVNVLRNDGLASMAIAAATGASFVRVNVFCGVAFSDQGTIEGQARDLHWLRRDLGTETRILADVHVKHAAHLTSIEEAAIDAERNGPDGLIVSGIATGRRTSPEDLQAVKSSTSLPVLVGSGVRIDNVSTYRDADGFIVGTLLKREGVLGAPVDVDRVRALADAVASLRPDG